ncbi:enoyl-CoA hydratase/isomerase family protein [Rhodococcus sp. IEGM 1379]|uniref:enoyl-CoA hydratase/isomerase family protein n=1 Tax=Rhodococcus sp. IEGM 1379 TaxID=3047086 RepID=UPI0024B64D1F|nr:enoyl-CoA hydratase/isomerase family protein [Rhodococcus sp. IEGM 1379]MDI9916868.1 enoyl-CoA hydratase/isomerase family protein [Rhodococcus sp. IEGM 1379]
MTVRIQRTGRVGTITLDRPPANAFDETQTAALVAAVTDLDADSDIGVVLIRSDQRIFCGGADIAMMDSWSGTPDRGDRLRRFTAALQDAYALVESMHTPSVAALAGAATGGGLELALACDFRVAGSGIKLGLPEVGIGLLPGAGGTQRLTRIAGLSVAYRIILGAELVSGREAERLGIVHWATDGDVDAEALALAERLGKLPPLAYGAAKRCIAAAHGDGGYVHELDEISRLIETPETTRLLEGFIARSASTSR